MEEGFQRYLGTGNLPVRNMQRLMGTRITTLRQLLDGDAPVGTVTGSGQGRARRETVPAERIRVRKLVYHIDRREYQDGSIVCSGWAFARTWDGRSLPVNIRITNGDGADVFAEVGRRDRRDVADALKIRNAKNPVWGFDCVWVAPPKAGWKIHFSLGNREKIYEG